MAKIVKIEVQNFKAIAEKTLNLNGCSVIIIGKNNSGKTSLLRGLCDRIQGLQPSIVIKQGENNGYVIMDLTDGCKVSWKFTDKSEQIVYTTSDGLEIKSGVIKYIQQKYFGNSANFDIDTFVRSSPQEQRKILLKLIGLDFSEIDNKYKLACTLRTEAKNSLQALKSNGVEKPNKVDPPEDYKFIGEDIRKLTELDEKAKKAHEDEYIKTYNEWAKKEAEEKDKIHEHNRIQAEREQNLWNCDSSIQAIIKCYKDLERFGMEKFDNSKLIDFFSKLPKPERRMEYKSKPAPVKTCYDSKCKKDIINLTERLNKILTNDVPAYQYYVSALERYNKYVEQLNSAEERVKTSDENVKKIEKEKAEIIKSSKMPEGFSFDDNGLLYNGFSLNKQSQSASSMYIAGIKLATMNLGELKAIHFDASYLDKNSVEEVQKYADNLGLQLLIERVSYDGEEISYHIIEKT